MGLCRYLPTPSDRMGVLWSLLTIEDSIVLEYGPAGTTHYSMGFFSKINVDQENRIFTTHMSEDDVIMGDVSRLESAIVELDETFSPKIIFVVASSVSAVIGTDIRGVCAYTQNDIKAQLVSFEQGGFKGDYSIGLCDTYELIVKELVVDSAKQEKTYNIIGASAENYRMISDIKEVQYLMMENFGYKLGTSLCTDTSVDKIKNMSGAQINLVLSYEGLRAAEYLKKTFGTEYIYAAPYGYHGTLTWLESISKAINVEINPEIRLELNEKIQEISQYRMYSMMAKNIKPVAYIFSDYDKLNGLADYLTKMCITVQHKICKHTLRNISEPLADVKYLPTEKDRIDILESLEKTLILADDISNSIANKANTFLRVTTPCIKGSQIATHMPFMGIKGADFIREKVDEYFSIIL